MIAPRPDLCQMLATNLFLRVPDFMYAGEVALGVPLTDSLAALGFG